MKENDFHDIGKRLHHMEADVPQDGWKKIGAALREENSSARAAWWTRHGWKPLLLLIPALVYFVIPNINNGSTANVVEAAETESNSVEKLVAIESSTIPTTKQTGTGQALHAPMQRASLADEESNHLNDSDESEFITSNDSKVVQHDVNPSQPNDNLSEAEAQLTPIPEAAPDADSVNQVLITSNLAEIDSAELQAIIPDKKNKALPWRISASVIPQYQGRTVQPATTDEVMMTNVNKPEWRSQLRAGWALGVGKAVSPNLYLDMHLSYVSIQQDIYFGYATGKVDTLLALLQADQTVQVTPVYELNFREIRSKYNYAGLRLAATYYFWNTTRSRWNLMAGAGTHYMVAASVKEKTETGWTLLPEDNLNRTNFSFTLGGGYNWLLNHGWELQVNPSLTYYIKEAKSQSLPYSMNQRSAGITLMVSKTLGR